MTDDGPVVSSYSSARPPWVVPAVQSLVILALFAGVGWLAGRVWWELWSPAPTGVVYQGQWIPQPYAEGQGADFAGTGWYVVVAVVAGLVVGLVAGLLLDRHEIVTLVAVAVGSALGAWLMLRVGLDLSPPDPESLAKTAKEGAELPGQLELAGRLDAFARIFGGRFHDEVRTPMLAFPIGAMTGLAIALFGITKRRD